MRKNTGRSPENKNLGLPWGKGQTGNPKGRPLGAKDGIRASLRRELNKAACPDVLAVLKGKGLRLSDKTNAGAIAAILIDTAIKGDIQAIKMIMEQTEVPLKTEHDINMRNDPSHRTNIFIRLVKAGQDGKPVEGVCRLSEYGKVKKELEENQLQPFIK